MAVGLFTAVEKFLESAVGLFGGPSTTDPPPTSARAVASPAGWSNPDVFAVLTEQVRNAATLTEKREAVTRLATESTDFATGARRTAIDQLAGFRTAATVLAPIAATPAGLQALVATSQAAIADANRNITNGLTEVRRQAGRVPSLLPMRPVRKSKKPAKRRRVRPQDRRSTLTRGNAGPGVRQALEFAKAMDSAGYRMGGFGRNYIDCSGMVAATVNVALGRDAFESRMSTMNERQWLMARGARPGLGGPEDLNIGFYDRGGGANGHTAMTLAGVNIESNGSQGVVIGGNVGADHSMFDQRMHIPAEQLNGRRSSVA